MALSDGRPDGTAGEANGPAILLSTTARTGTAIPTGTIGAGGLLVVRAAALAP
jgi:hypothetical protein